MGTPVIATTANIQKGIGKTLKTVGNNTAIKIC